MENTDPMEDRLHLGYQIMASSDMDEITSLYDQWAPTYENDVKEVLGCLVQEQITSLVLQYAQKDARILDVGAGTGILGALLFQQGYHNLVALDKSAGMLEEAGKHQVYAELLTMSLSEPLAIPDHAFDAVVSSSVLCYHPFDESVFDELIRVTRPGGFLLFDMRPEQLNATDVMSTALPRYWQKLAEHEDRGNWKRIVKTDWVHLAPEVDEEGVVCILIYQIPE